MVAVGDSSGKIHLWHGLPTSPDDDTPQTPSLKTNLRGKKAATVVLHWHAHEVKTLAFGHQGLQLFSGGDEAVLVIWQLESRDLNFLPRLGGALNTIRTSRDGMSLCICCDNNSVRVVNITSLGTIWQHSGLTTLASSARKYRKRCGDAIVDPITEAVVIPTCNGGAGASLQFWNAKEDTCMASLDVSHRNRVSRKESGRKNRAPRAVVEAFDFSKDGSWLVTVDSTIVGEKSLCQRTIRFWNRKSIETTASSLKFVAFAAMSENAETKVGVASFGSTSSLLVTTHISSTSSSSNKRLEQDQENCFKVWETYVRKRVEGPAQWALSSSSSNNGSSKSLWRCRGIGRYRGLVPNSASWSSDDSILVVGFQNVATLWGGECRNTLLRTISHPSSSPIRSLQVLSDDMSFVPYLAVVSKERLSVHNLLDMSLKWEHYGDVRFGTAASNSSRNRFALGISSARNSNEFVVAEFEPKSRVPIASSSTLLSKRNVLPSVAYFKGSRAPLCCVESTGKLSIVGLPGCMDGVEGLEENMEEEDKREEDDVLTIMGDRTFENLIGSIEQHALEKNESSISNDVSFEKGLDFKISELLKGPSHTLPQPRVILQCVLRAMIPQIENDDDDDDDDDTSDDESESEDEEEKDAVESVQESNNIQSIISEHAVVAAIEADDARGMSCIEMSESIFGATASKRGNVKTTSSTLEVTSPKKKKVSTPKKKKVTTPKKKEVTTPKKKKTVATPKKKKVTTRAPPKTAPVRKRRTRSMAGSDEHLSLSDVKKRKKTKPVEPNSVARRTRSRRNSQ